MRRILLIAAVLFLSGCAPAHAPTAAVQAGTPTSASSPSPADTSADTSVSRVPVKPISYPRSGSGHWRVAPGRGAIAGDEGPLRRYRVAVERGITGIRLSDFADTVETTLSDRRSWTGLGDVRLQRVGPHDDYDFTIHLATPKTRDDLCGDTAAGNVDEYTSCRNGTDVVLNVARWVHGVPKDGAPLRIYRTYMINHETGHALGHHHELCPGPGRKAPVMQQQTLGLHGCTANGWPVVGGKLLSGAAGQYGDPVPDPVN